MSPHRIVWTVFAVALAVVVVMVVVQAMRAVREMNRLNRRIEDLGDLPLVKKLARAEDDVRRLEAAAARVAPLLVRAEAAMAVIKRGPLPPEFVRAIVRVSAEIAAFRAFARR
ncbi:MAG TPA: hypothetical protein VHS78_02635 [Candidatus Elarobacter sp.]|nr:hypothetical protein [Candidatus Elarobacter sp.]